MGRNKKKTEIGDVELLIWMLQKEWSCSKEPVWKVEVPACILKACNKEVGKMSRYFQYLYVNGLICEDGTNEVKDFPLSRAVISTKDAYVLIRVAKKLLAASKESVNKKQFIVALDDEEYKFVTSRFWEYL